MPELLSISQYLTNDDLKSIRDWIPKMIKRRTRSEHKKADRAKKALKLRYEVIGSGKTRIVYDLGNGYVVKIAISKRGLKSNDREYDVYTHCSRRMRRFLCPIVEFGHGWLIMKKLKRVVLLTELDDNTLLKLKRRFLKEKVVARSLRSKNFAMSRNRLIFIDYGSFRFTKRE